MIVQKGLVLEIHWWICWKFSLPIFSLQTLQMKEEIMFWICQPRMNHLNIFEPSQELGGLQNIRLNNKTNDFQKIQTLFTKS